MAYIITSRTQLRATDKPPPGSMVDWQHPLAQGLVSCFVFPFNLVDYKTHNIASLVNGATWNKNGVLLDGTNDRIDVGLGYAFDPANPKATLLAKVLRTGAGDFARIQTIYSSGGTTERLLLQRYHSADPINSFAGNWTGTTNCLTIAESNSFLINVVTVLGAVFSGTTAPVLYKDGVVIGNFSTLDGATLNTPNGNLSLGGRASDNTRNLPGTIEYSYIFGRPLNADQIASLYYNPYQFFFQPKRRVIFVPTGAPQNFAPDCATATGQAYDPSIVASGDAPFAVDVATGTGQAYDPGIVASGSVTFTPDTATGTGSAYDPGIVATGDAVFAPDTATGTGASYDPALAFIFVPDTATGTGAAYIPGVTATGEAPVDPDTPTGDGTAHDPSITNIPTPPPAPSAAATTCVGRSSGADSIRCYGASTNADGCQTKGRRGGSNSLRSYGVSSS